MSEDHIGAEEREERLAQELADSLGEPANVGRYQKIAKRYSESHIRAVLSTVLNTPAERIRTSRAAFFNWLVQHYDSNRPERKDPREYSRDDGDRIGQ